MYMCHFNLQAVQRVIAKSTKKVHDLTSFDLLTWRFPQTTMVLKSFLSRIAVCTSDACPVSCFRTSTYVRESPWLSSSMLRDPVEKS